MTVMVISFLLLFLSGASLLLAVAIDYDKEMRAYYRERRRYFDVLLERKESN